MVKKKNDLTGLMFGVDVPEGGIYIASRNFIVSGDECRIEGIVNGKELEGERMDYAWRHRDSDRVLIDVTVKDGIRTFTIVRFADKESKEMFIMKYGLYVGVGDNALAMPGKLN